MKRFETLRGELKGLKHVENEKIFFITRNKIKNETLFYKIIIIWNSEQIKAIILKKCETT